MATNIGSIRSGSVHSFDSSSSPVARGNERNLSQLSGQARVGQVTTTVVNPLHGNGPTAQTHYTDRNGQVQPRSLHPLAYDAGQLRADVGKATSWGRIKNAVPFFGKTTYGDILKLADRYGAAAPGLSPEQKTAQLKGLQAKLDGWQAKHGDGAGPGASAKEKAVAALAVAVAGAVDEARFDSVQAARTALLPKLPHGATISQDGMIGGSTRITGIPRDAKGLDEFHGKSLAEFSAELATRGITPKADKAGQVKPLGTIGGIPVAGQAANDLYRLDLTIHGPGGDYVSRADPETRSGERNETAVSQLRAFTGSDQATTVLSGIVNQQILRPLSDGMAHADGSQAQFALGHHAAPGQVKQPDGGFEAVKMYNMGSAAFDLAKTPEGNFKISVEWPMYITDTGRGSAAQPLPGMQPGDVIKAHGRMELIIDAQEAAAGRVRVTTPNPASVTFSGGINP